MKYWLRQPYLGFGLDAHSMVRTPAGSALRFCTVPVLADYLRGDRGENPRRLSSSEELEEAWFLGLRLRAGSNGRRWLPSSVRSESRSSSPS